MDDVTPTPRVCVSLPAAMLDAVRATAEAESRSIASVVRHAVADWLRQRGESSEARP